MPKIVKKQQKKGQKQAFLKTPQPLGQKGLTVGKTPEKKVPGVLHICLFYASFTLPPGAQNLVYRFVRIVFRFCPILTLFGPKIHQKLVLFT
jgi:hypothetical protein